MSLPAPLPPAPLPHRPRRVAATRALKSLSALHLYSPTDPPSSPCGSHPGDHSARNTTPGNTSPRKKSPRDHAPGNLSPAASIHSSSTSASEYSAAQQQPRFRHRRRARWKWSKERGRTNAGERGGDGGMGTGMAEEVGRDGKDGVYKGEKERKKERRKWRERRRLDRDDWGVIREAVGRAGWDVGKGGESKM